uniref:Uncharacterized protein n=1 Tax=Attheya septentrionalis TaxID=420275 RepID=A0A7S2XR90_9STRA|mmetsp:Transcript_29376/g.53808  ORF Transcript_29376/g.53808 Transcript_29376/m.53808 type:complete len:221 (+) Transcript_29376:48-710(+)|eukprot:CAMPEP_0198302910 /NCGR_PEP_ID=MMETSP1449-20131203/56615_1 /TAXON_ID=420275 /ORGANISM="Attheya septentrionalis, Strain CCMP2084" /LENGTH=220 /DNA_ID=CAMNT_0044005389 /DNA_START=29 /DNA_END=691 /DNA_ORIENTATION=+
MTDMFLSPPWRSRQQVRRICSLVWLIVIPALRMDVASAFVVVHHHPPVVTSASFGGVSSSSFTAAGGRPFQGMRTTGTELAAVEEWRQYVPLGTALLVIVDILLGSPVANSIMAPMKQASEEANNEKNGGTASTPRRRNPKERVDTNGVAQAALDRARNSMELRSFLEAQKTDWDRMNDIRKTLDSQTSQLETNLSKIQPKTTKSQDTTVDNEDVDSSKS